MEGRAALLRGPYWGTPRMLRGVFVKSECRPMPSLATILSPRHSSTLELRGKPRVVFLLRLQCACTGDDLLCQFTPALPLKESRTEEAILCQPLAQFMRSSGMLSLGARRGKRNVVMRLGKQAGDGVLREPGGFAMLALVREAEEDKRVVREGVTRFA